MRAETSLLEGRCDCDDVNKENEQLKDDLKTEKDKREALELELGVMKKETKEKSEKLSNMDEKTKKELQDKLIEIQNLSDTIENTKKELAKIVAEKIELKEENDKLRKESEGNNNPESSQELQSLHSIIQVGEKAIKKAYEEHKKEIAEQKRAKQNAEENLNSVIQEKTKIKEKETTMYEIMEGLRKLLNIKDKDLNNKATTTNSNNLQDKTGVNVVDGASGGAVPKVQYNCEQCKFSATNMNILNKHIRQELITTLYPCITCDFQAKTIVDLREHQNTHIGDQVSRKTSVTCELCNFATDTQASLHMHERNIHKKSKYHWSTSAPTCQLSPAQFQLELRAR